MALEGKSTSAVVAVLQCAGSRNAVIGKANRIGVKLTGNIHCLARRAQLGRAQGDPVDRQWPARIAGEARHHPALAARAEAGAWAFAQAQVGEMLKIGLEEIKQSAVAAGRSAVPTSEEFAYSGIQAAKELSYC